MLPSTFSDADRKPFQVLLKWHAGHWFAIRRGPTGVGYTVEAHDVPNYGRTVVPVAYMPITQGEVAEEFARQGKEWRAE